MDSHKNVVGGNQSVFVRLFAMGMLLLTLQTFAAVTTNGPTVAVTEEKPTIGAPSKWVMPLAFERLSPLAKLDPGEEFRWLLWDEQVNAQTNEFFFHFVRQILNTSGVQRGSRIEVDFDPAYESLVFHWVKISRGTNRLDRLMLEKIRVIQKETELSEDLLNGRHSALLVLDDVRVGDVIDYSYSLCGKNPVEGSKFVTSFPLQMHSPVERLSSRLLWPAHRRVYWKTQGVGIFQPSQLQQSNLLELKWDYRKVAGLHLEDSLPVWYNPLPRVQLSEFQTWSEVNQWALGLYTNSTPLSPELTSAIAEWRRLPGKQEQVLSVLQFVQNDVRYLGIEIGEGGCKPTSPSTVFARRFGDCKDKSMLFVTILRSLGIEAWPVLVNTEARHMLDSYQPSIGVFDHAIAMVRLDKQVYWLDCTARFQRGALAERYLPNYERGLVICPGTVGLTVIPPSSFAPSTTETQFFTVKGKTEPATLKVVVSAEGAGADALRQRFSEVPLAEIEKKYLNYYTALYPGIVQAQPVSFTDDEKENRFEITEVYTINNFWSYNANRELYQCTFTPHSLDGAMNKPGVLLRSMPLGISFPEHRVSRIEITMPRAWSVKQVDKTVEGPFFYFHSERSSSLNKITLEYEYRSLSDTVSTAAMPEYIQQLEEASRLYDDLVLDW